jgi:hypothetical protein
VHWINNLAPEDKDSILSLVPKDLRKNILGFFRYRHTLGGTACWDSSQLAPWPGFVDVGYGSSTSAHYFLISHAILVRDREKAGKISSINGLEILVVPPPTPQANPKLALQAEGVGKQWMTKHGQVWTAKQDQIFDSLDVANWRANLTKYLLGEWGDIELTGALGDWYVFVLDIGNLQNIQERIEQCRKMQFSFYIPRLEVIQVVPGN